MNIAVVQFYTSNINYGPYSEAINKKYCDEKGYTYFCEKDNLKIRTISGDRSLHWYKIKLVQEILGIGNFDYILFLDADAVFSDFNKNIEDFIDENYNIVFAEDIGHHSSMNTGVFLVKNNEWTKNFLNIWWTSGEIYKGKDSENLPIMEENLEKIGYFKQALWHEQTCITLLYRDNEDVKNNIKVISNRSFNHREYNEGNFIFHAYAYGHSQSRTLDSVYYKVFNITPNISGNKLSEIASAYRTDKQHEHDYFKLIYDDLFEPISNSVTKFVEVGINKGGSLELWRDYFKNATIYGLDINTDINIYLERIELIRLDQSNETQLKEFSQNYSEIDVIMDDGSHRMYDQQITFATLFKSLKPGGIYVLEDLHTSLEVVMPEKNWCGWGDPNKTITLNMLNDFTKTGKIESDYLTEDDKEYLNNNIKSINVYQSKPDWSITSVIIKK